MSISLRKPSAKLIGVTQTNPRNTRTSEEGR